MANCNTHIFVIEEKLILCFEKTHTLNKTVERKFSEIYFSKRLIFLLTKSLLRYKNVFFNRQSISLFKPTVFSSA